MSRYSEFLKVWASKLDNAKQTGDKKILKAYDRLFHLIENISEKDFVEFLKTTVKKHVSSERVYVVTQKDETGKVKRYELVDDLAKPFTRLVFSLPEYGKSNVPISERISGIQWNLGKSKDKLMTKEDLAPTWEKIFYQRQDDLCSKRYMDLDGSGKLPSWKTYVRETEEESE